MNVWPSHWLKAPLAEINKFNSRSIDPSSFPEEVFELYSVPSFAWRHPEIVAGRTIGSSKQLVLPGDVLVCKINPRINRVWVVGEAGTHRQIASSEWIVISAPALVATFCRHYCSSPSFRELICADVTGVGGSLTRAQPKRVAELCFPVPPLAEQKRIADKLDTLLARIDACRDRLDRLPELIKRFREAVLDSAVAGTLPTVPQENDCSDWQVARLDEVCESISDGDHQAPPQTPSGIPFVTISAISGGRLRLEAATRYVPSSYFESLRPTRIPRFGDLLFSVTGSVGIAALVDTHSPFTFQRHIAILKPNLTRITSQFLLTALGSSNIRRQAKSVATGTAQMTIPLSGLRAMEIKVPSLRQQLAIDRQVKTLLGLADQLETRIRKAVGSAGSLPSATLAKAFRGELVPQDPSDESAQALLDRLKSQPNQNDKPKRGRRTTSIAAA